MDEILPAMKCEIIEEASDDAEDKLMGTIHHSDLANKLFVNTTGNLSTLADMKCKEEEEAGLVTNALCTDTTGTVGLATEVADESRGISDASSDNALIDCEETNGGLSSDASLIDCEETNGGLSSDASLIDCEEPNGGLSIDASLIDCEETNGGLSSDASLIDCGETNGGLSSDALIDCQETNGGLLRQAADDDQPEGIFQLIGKLETLTDKLIAR
jgi:hypothetical protein